MLTCAPPLEKEKANPSSILAQRVLWTVHGVAKSQTRLSDRFNLMDTLSLTKEARIYNGKKTITLTSGAGKTGQPHVRE